MTKKPIFLFVFLLPLLFLSGGVSQAYEIKSFKGTKAYNDFVLNPGKVEIALNPGETVTKEITVLNRSGVAIDFKVELEDFSGSQKDNENISLLGTATGPYSLKDYLKPELNNFTLQHGEQMTLPVVISVPKDSRPGGLYAAVILAGQVGGQNPSASAQVKAISRIASLFFVRVSGETDDSGQLIGFNSDHNFYFGGSKIVFDFTFGNTGNVYLSPYGDLTVKNLWGQPVFAKKVFAYYVMPNSARSQKEVWQNNLFGGAYRATIKLNRGYDNLADQRSIWLVVITYKLLVSLFAIGVIACWVGYKIYSANK